MLQAQIRRQMPKDGSSFALGWVGDDVSLKDSIRNAREQGTYRLVDQSQCRRCR